MNSVTESVVHGDVMNKTVLPPKSADEPKEQRVQKKFLWPPDLCDEIDELAKVSDRSINETGEILMRWAAEKARVEWGLSSKTAAGDAGHVKGKKP